MSDSLIEPTELTLSLSMNVLRPSCTVGGNPYIRRRASLMSLPQMPPSNAALSVPILIPRSFVAQKEGAERSTKNQIFLSLMNITPKYDTH